MKTTSELKNGSCLGFNKPLILQVAIGLKKVLAILLIAISTLAGFAQGKVSLQMDQPIIIGRFTLGPDAALANQPIPTSGPLPSGISIAVGLYAGTASTALSLVSSEIINPVGGGGAPDGFFPILHVTLPFPGGSFAFFQVKFWDAAFVSWEAEVNAGAWLNDYGGWRDLAEFSAVFQMIPGTGISYPSIITGGNSTWTAVGNEAVGWNVEIYPNPEPSSFALFALGAVVMLVSRWRRNASNH